MTMSKISIEFELINVESGTSLETTVLHCQIVEQGLPHTSVTPITPGHLGYALQAVAIWADKVADSHPGLADSAQELAAKATFAADAAGYLIRRL